MLAKLRAGLVTCMAAMLIILGYPEPRLKEISGTPEPIILIVCLAFVGCLCVILVRVRGRQPTARVSLWALTLAFLAPLLAVGTWWWVLGDRSIDERLYGGAMLIGSMMVLATTVFRRRAGWYLLFGVSAGAVVYLRMNSAWASILSGAGLLLALAVLHYGVRLLLDHRAELAKVMSLPFRAKALKAFAALILMTPVFVLAGLGIWINSAIQHELIATAYKENSGFDGDPLIPEGFGCTLTPVDGRKLEEDLISCTIAKMRNDMIASVKGALHGLDTASDSFSHQARAKLAELIEGSRPTPIDSGGACDSFQARAARVRITFRGPCRALVRTINHAIEDTYQRLAKRLSDEGSEIDELMKSWKEENAEKIMDLATIEITDSFSGLENGTRFAFTSMRAMELVGLLVLISSMIAAFQMMLG